MALADVGAEEDVEREHGGHGGEVADERAAAPHEHRGDEGRVQAVHGPRGVQREARARGRGVRAEHREARERREHRQQRGRPAECGAVSVPWRVGMWLLQVGGWFLLLLLLVLLLDGVMRRVLRGMGACVRGGMAGVWRVRRRGYDLVLARQWGWGAPRHSGSGRLAAWYGSDVASRATNARWDQSIPPDQHE